MSAAASSSARAEVARIAEEIGFVTYPTSSTDLLLVACTISLGAMIGPLALTVGSVSLSLSMSVGVPLAGFTLGHLRSVNPRFGRVPDAAVSLFHSLGLTAFLALVAIEAGPGVVAALRTSGALLLVATVVIVLVPHTVTILLGRYVVGLHPAIVLRLCAGAGTPAPALAALERAAGDRKTSAQRRRPPPPRIAPPP